MSDHVFELIKLLIQLAATAAIALWSVSAALNRYKEEKLWDRRVAAYSDLLAAMSAMRRLNRIWYNDLMRRRFPSDEISQKRAQEYESAKRNVEAIISVSGILLPPETQKTLQDHNEFTEKQIHLKNQQDELELEYLLLKNSMIEIGIQGRTFVRNEK